MNNSKWSLFYQFIQLHRMDKEERVQRAFEQLFADPALFGYSWLFGEVDAHRVLHIGSSDRVIPDLVIRDAAENKDLFLVELKQLNLSRSTAFEEQLLSYMRLLSLNIGLLICDAIYVYVLDHDKPLSYKIDVCEKSEEGERFLELFSKGNFNVEAVKSIVMKKWQSEDQVQKIKEELERLDVSYLIKLYFSDRYEEDAIDKALNDYIFPLEKKRGPLPPPPPDEKKKSGGKENGENGGKSEKKKYNYNGETKICRIVLNIVKDYAEKNHTSFAILSGVFPSDLQGSLGVVRDEAYLQQSNWDRKGRFFTKPDEVLHLTDGAAYVCTQWAGPNNFQKFLIKARGLGYIITESDE